MYLEHYRLKLNPFQITADPSFLWLGDKHREALAVLRNGTMVHRGCVLLTGEAGTGKTVSIKRLISEVDFEVALVTLTGPDLNIRDFYNLLSDSFNAEIRSGRRDDFIPYLHDFSQRHAGRKQVLIIDEAQWLNADLMKEIRWLSNIKVQDRKLIDLFLVGEPELNALLSAPENHDLALRITVRHQIEPLEEREIAAYIEHRLETAGCDLEIFTPPATFAVFELTGGVPRLINKVCDRALQIGGARGLERIDENVIRECAAELKLPPHTQKVKDDPPAAARTDEDPEGIKKHHLWNLPPRKIIEPKPVASQEHRTARADHAIPPPKIRQAPPAAPKANPAAGTSGGVQNSAANFQRPEILASKISEPKNDPIPVDRARQADPPIQNPTAKEDPPAVPRTGRTTGRIPSSAWDHPPQEILDPSNEPRSRRKILWIFPILLLVAYLAYHFDYFPLENETLPDEAASAGAADGASDPLNTVRMPSASTGHTSYAEEGKENRPPSRSEDKLMITFDPSSNELDGDSLRLLDIIARRMVVDPRQTLTIRGYTDSSGPLELNLSISRQRAESVKSYLVDKGAESEKMEIIAMGPQNPIASNDTSEGRRQNRRVELEFSQN